MPYVQQKYPKFLKTGLFPDFFICTVKSHNYHTHFKSISGELSRAVFTHANKNVSFNTLTR